MAVLKVEEQSHQRTGGDNVNVLQWASVRLFLVYTNNATDDDGVALFAVDPMTGITVPPLLSAHPTRPFLFVSSRACRWVDEKAGKCCEVSINYTVISGLAPWQEPAVWSGAGDNADKIIDYDVVTYQPLWNSAFQPYDPPVTAARFNPTITIQKAILNFDTSLQLQYADSVNSTSFMGADEGYCLCTGIPWTTATWISPLNVYFQYYNVTFNFAFKNPQGDDWQSHVLDAGLMQLNSDGTLVPILIGGREPSSPVPLNGSGQPLAPNATPIYNDAKIYPEMDFNQLQSLWS